MSLDSRPGTSGSRSRANLARSYPLSVVIPCHNSGPALERCLQGLWGNDLDQVEAWVIDDGSTDITGEVVRQFSEAPPPHGFSFHYLRREQRSGPAAARNEGLRRARHPYLLFLDSDVELPERSIEWIRDTLDLYSHRGDVAGVLGSYTETIPEPDFFTHFKNLSVCYLYQSTNTLSPFLHTAVFCVKREILEQVGGFDRTVATAEDFRLGILLGSRGYRFVIDRRIKGVHLKRYRLKTVLGEDWRRIRDLRSLPLEPGHKVFAARAHRPHRLLSMALPGPILGLGLMSWWDSRFAMLALALLAIFYLCQGPFLIYCARWGGLGFGLRAAFFVFIEMLWAELALVGSLGSPALDPTPAAKEGR